VSIIVDLTLSKENTMKEYEPRQSFMRVATACPEVAVGNVAVNTSNISETYAQAVKNDVSLVLFPELSLTGYTIGDLVNQNNMLNQAKDALGALAHETEDNDTAMIVGLPMQVGNSLYNCAAVLAGGNVQGIVPKQNLPTYGEFYEDRWYQSWQQPNAEVGVGENKVPFGTELLFEVGGVKTGVEICEDLWVASPPSNRLAENGALIIANPSASPEQIGKDAYRRQLVANQSGRLIASYLYAGCHESESTMDIVMSGHQLIAENGRIAEERKPFDGQELVVADIDIEHLAHDRRRQGMANNIGSVVVPIQLSRTQEDLINVPQKHPFLPVEDPEARKNRLEHALQIQAQGLATRMKNTGQNRVVLGLSGGLDSTLALLVACETAKLLEKEPADFIRTITMPGPASSEGTQQNAQKLAGLLGVLNEVKPIKELVEAELKLLGHNGEQDVTYENVQARARTEILFNYGNQEHCLVLGTGDLSEIALGWCTFNADHMSHYNVNATIPKTLVKHLVAHASQKYPDVSEVLNDILDTPISPELTKEDESLSQETEDIIGPYELHDFFMSYHLRWGDAPEKITYLARQAFKDNYDEETINKWLKVYFDRFARNQFKRSVMPDGPKVGSVALSPRGDWRMPSDMNPGSLWNS
jgi:NAD+ synthase (glutamine-hydrolysing)